MGRCCEDDFVFEPRCNENNSINNAIEINRCTRCGNLLENPSFEADLSGWTIDNVVPSGGNAFEGLQTAQMNQPISSMFQDFFLENNCRKPLILSFEVSPNIISVPAAIGPLAVEVLWLNDNREVIGTGLRTFIPNEVLSVEEARLTFVEVTDVPPINAAMARVQFTKGLPDISSQSVLEVDNVILALIESTNLVRNSGFQLGLRDWIPTNVTAEFTRVYEGTGRVNLGPNAVLIQNVPLTQFFFNSNFLLSFAVAQALNANFPGGTFLRVQVIWLNGLGATIGTGLDLSIDGEANLFDYTTYADVTNVAPAGAVAAQIRFTNTDPNFAFVLDKVIFARVRSENLIQNPSFENAVSIDPWTAVGTTVVQSTNSYEGNRYASIALGGGAISQEVPVEPRNCYLLNFGFKVDANVAGTSTALAQVYWLDRNGQEIGLGLTIIIHRRTILVTNIWSTYLGVTEPAPENAVRARIQFSKLATQATGDIDKVVFTRL